MSRSVFFSALLSGLLLLLYGAISAQQALPTPYSAGTAINAVRTYTAQRPFVNPGDIVAGTVTVADAVQTTQYTDGYGRPLETVTRGASPLGSDLVTANTYDSDGREQLRYLPFTANAAQTGDVINDGNFKTDPFQEQTAFYNGYLSGQTGETGVGASGLTWAYAQRSFEASPLNRVTAAYPPGVNWVGSQSHSVQSQQLVNTATDNVQIWNIGAWSLSSPESNIIPTDGGAYGAGELSKTIGTDEAGHQSIQFKDQYGQMILQKIQLTSTDNGTGSAHAGWLCTYYVYDDNGLLRFTIPSAAVAGMDGTWTISQAVADQYCYRYEYDNLNRMIIQKTPGTPSGSAGEIWMVYDERNRVVMKQDGNLRSQQKWEYLQYDVLDRQITEGLMTDPSNYNNLTYHTTNASTSTAYPNTASYTTELLQQTFYDDYTWISGTNSSSLTGTMDVSVNGSGNSIFSTTYNTAPVYAQPITQTVLTRGLAMGTKTEVLGSNGSKYIYSVFFYDDKGRVLQIQRLNYTGGKDITTTQYNWEGRVLASLISHNKSGTNAQTHLAGTRMTYDPMGRLLTTTKTISSTVNGVAIPVATAQVVTNSYDELGRLKIKNLAPYYNSNAGLESLTYDYNVRGWILGENRGYISGASGNHFFGQEVAYDNTTSVAAGNTYLAAEYNGATAGTVWKSKGDGINRKYDFSYDKSKRMTSAPFQQNSSAASWDNGYIDFSVGHLAYDLNGNIDTLKQNGFLLGGSQTIDNLSYSYGSSGASNQLQRVMDASNNAQSVLGDFHYPASKTSSQIDYTYDANGNVISDYNRGISSISYDCLNLPQTFHFGSNDSIYYVYDASGVKWQKIVQDNNDTVAYKGTSYPTSITTTNTYIGGFQYRSVAYSNAALAPLQYTDNLQFVGQDEGRIRATYTNTASPNLQTGYAFDYFVRDNLNNTRMVLTDESQTDAYPAATVETSTYNGGRAASYEAQYYTIDSTRILTDSTELPWLAGDQGGIYQNQNNGGTPSNSMDPYSNTTANSAKVYWLNGSTGNSTGLGITLKVMAGDNISIFGKSVWHNTGATVTSYPITSILASFLNAFAGTPAVAGELSGVALNNISATALPLQDLLNNTPNQPSPTTQPKAAINWILFDNQFRPVAMSSDLVNSTPDQVKSHSLMNILMQKSGYLYVYCSNETNIDVYFDNLQVVNIRGPLLAETHYYPEGLVMTGISDLAYNKLANRYDYQGREWQTKEFNNGTGLEEDDFGSRYYDHQLGVWHNQDPANQYASPYLAMGNSWPNGKDPNGQWFGLDDLIVSLVGFAVGYVADGIETHHWGGQALLSGLAGAAIAEGGYLTLGGGLAATAGAGNTALVSASGTEALVTGGAGTMSGAVSFAATYATTDAASLLQNSGEIQQASPWGAFGLIAGYSVFASVQAGMQSNFMQGKIDGLLGVTNTSAFGGAMSNGIGGFVAGAGNSMLQAGSLRNINLDDVISAANAGFESNFYGQVAHNGVGNEFTNLFGASASKAAQALFSNAASAITQQTVNNLFGGKNFFKDWWTTNTVLQGSGGWPNDALPQLGQ